VPAGLGSFPNGGFNMSGYVAEVIATKGPASDAEVKALEDQLMAKYAIVP
jgi:hypothetical protein